MKTFCVPSHHYICSDPASQQGVLLNLEMLTQGIWFPIGGMTNDTEEECRKTIKLRRSENQAEYTAALAALMSILNNDSKLIAVVSMRWCSLTYRLITGKRVWLTLYRKNIVLCSFSHKRDRPTYNFCECWAEPDYEQHVWEERFKAAIKTGHQS